MLKKCIDFSLGNALLVAFLALATLAAACELLRRMPVDVFPDLDMPRVVIQTEAGGLTAEEVEQFVTMPLEAAVNGLPGVTKVRSSSGGGLSFVWVDFAWGEDLYRARQLVAERLASVQETLPASAKAEISPITSVTGEILLLALSAENPSQGADLQLRSLAEIDLRNRLLAISGIGQVVVIGGQLPEYQVQVDPERLMFHGLSLDDVVKAAGQSGTLASGGYLPNVGGMEYPLRQEARVSSLQDLQRTLVALRGGVPLTLGQVADIGLGGAPRRGAAANNGRAAVVLSIQKTPGSNTLALTRQIDAALDEFSASRLPKGVKLDRLAYRQADFINASISNGLRILRDAAIVVAIILALFLMNIRTAVITLLAMPMSLALALLAFPAFGLGINIMTLGGLAVAVGDVVDNAIIFVEIAHRRLRENHLRPAQERQTAVQVLRAASDEILSSVSFATLIIALVFVPLLFLGGIEGQFFRPLGIAYILAMLGSLLVAVTLTPALCLLVLTGGKAHEDEKQESPTSRWLKRLYAPLLGLMLRFRTAVCAAALALTLACCWLASTFGTSFLPTFHEGCYTVFLMTPPGTSLDESDRLATQVEKNFAKIPGVLGVCRRTGRAERDQHAEPVSNSEIQLRVDLKADAKAIRAAIDREVAGIPGAAAIVGQPIAHRISAVLSGTSAEVTVNIFGNDLEQLRRLTAEVKTILAGIPAARDVNANREILVETVRIRYRMQDLARWGLTLAEVGEQVSAAFNGVKAGEIVEGNQRRDIVVRLIPNARDDLRDVGELMLSNSSGTRLRLREVADVFREEASNLVVRENTRRKSLLTCNVAEGSNLGHLVAEIRRQVDPVVQKAGCTVAYSGQFEAQQSAVRLLFWLGSAVIGIVVVLLVLALKSFRTALLVLINLPLALIGGIAAIYVSHEGPLLANTLALAGMNSGKYVAPVVSVAAVVGYVTLLGMAIRNGLLLLNRYRELQEAGIPVRQAILDGSRERLLPILMTALVTALGLFPVARAVAEPGGELLAPLALVQLGGLLSSTFLTLLVLPAAYSLVFERTPAGKN